MHAHPAVTVRRSYRWVLALASLALAARSTQAAFPGANGSIVFEDDNVVKMIAPTGQGVAAIPDTTGAKRPAVSADGKRIAVDGVRIFDVSGANSIQLAAGIQPAWSPSGTQIVFQSGFDLFIMQADGSGTPQPLTTGDDRDEAPSWSPGGDLIAFVSDRSGDTQVWTIKPNGSDAKQISAIGSVDFARPSWSPDGTKLVYSIDDGTIVDLYVTSVSVNPPDVMNDLRITVNGSSAIFNDEPAWSPDGTKIAFSSNRTGAREIWVVNAPSGGGDDQITTSGGRNPDWQRLVDEEAVPEQSACDAGKIKCVDKKQACLLAVHATAESKGTPPDSAKLQACKDKFDGGSKGFAKGCIGKLEAKQNPAKPKTVCTVTGDVASLEAAVDGFVVDAVSTIDPGFPSVGLPNKCDAAKKKCVAQKTSCLLKEHRRVAAKGLAPDAATLQKCRDKFEGGSKGFAKGCIGKLENKQIATKPQTVCSVTDDVAVLEGKVDAVVSALVSAIQTPP